MYVFAEPYEEDEIDAIQTGEYIQALRMAEARGKERREKEKEKEKEQKLDTESAATFSGPSEELKTTTSSEEGNDPIESTTAPTAVS